MWSQRDALLPAVIGFEIMQNIMHLNIISLILHTPNKQGQKSNSYPNVVWQNSKKLANTASVQLPIINLDFLKILYPRFYKPCFTFLLLSSCLLHSVRGRPRAYFLPLLFNSPGTYDMTGLCWYWIIVANNFSKKLWRTLPTRDGLVLTPCSSLSPTLAPPAQSAMFANSPRPVSFLDVLLVLLLSLSVSQFSLP